jgi:hypothetical protein
MACYRDRVQNSSLPATWPIGKRKRCRLAAQMVSRVCTGVTSRARLLNATSPFSVACTPRQDAVVELDGLPIQLGGSRAAWLGMDKFSKVTDLYRQGF